MTVELTANVTAGKIVLEPITQGTREQLAKLEGQRVRLTVAPWKRTRSTRQLRYYRGVVLKLLSEHTGHSCDEMHLYLCVNFLRIAGVDGSLDRYLTTSDLSTSEMEDFLRRVREWASSDLSVWIPEPHEDA